jgi:hypothetical protein
MSLSHTIISHKYVYYFLSSYKISQILQMFVRYRLKPRAKYIFWATAILFFYSARKLIDNIENTHGLHDGFI